MGFNSGFKGLNIATIALHYSYAGTGIFGQSVTISGTGKITLIASTPRNQTSL